MKIRLHGLKNELLEAKEIIEDAFNVNAVSAPYADRGESKYYRVYIDAEIKGPKAKKEVVKNEKSET